MVFSIPSLSGKPTWSSLVFSSDLKKTFSRRLLISTWVKLTIDIINLYIYITVKTLSQYDQPPWVEDEDLYIKSRLPCTPKLGYRLNIFYVEKFSQRRQTRGRFFKTKRVFPLIICIWFLMEINLRKGNPYMTIKFIRIVLCTWFSVYVVEYIFL